MNVRKVDESCVGMGARVEQFGRGAEGLDGWRLHFRGDQREGVARLGREQRGRRVGMVEVVEHRPTSG